MKIKQEIQKWRSSKASELNLPIHYIFDNKTLSHLVEILPLAEYELLEIKGFGPKKSEVYGNDVISIIKTSLFDSDDNEDC